MGERELVIDIYDRKGRLLGIFIDARLWERIGKELSGVIAKALEEIEKKGEGKPEDFKEPLEDWEVFKKCWDFNYPYDFSVRCDICGNKTSNWEKDREKKFLLTAASVSGLVSFRCMKCRAKIVKKHFKDKITFEAIPYTSD